MCTASRPLRPRARIGSGQYERVVDVIAGIRGAHGRSPGCSGSRQISRPFRCLAAPQLPHHTGSDSAEFRPGAALIHELPLALALLSLSRYAAACVFSRALAVKAVLLGTVLGAAVIAGWFSVVGFARLRAPLDRLHCVTLLNLTAGTLLAAAAVLRGGER